MAELPGHHRSALAFGAALALCAGLVACSSAGHQPTGYSSSSPSSLSTQLLDAADLSGYHSAASSDSPSEALPCAASSQRPLLTRFPPAAHTSAIFESTSTNSAIRELLLRYSSDTAASSAYAGVQAGYGCSTGMLGSATVTISHVGQVSANGQRADRWNMTIAGGTYATTMLGQAGADVVVLTFVADQTGADEADPGIVLLKALDKLTGS